MVDFLANWDLNQEWNIEHISWVKILNNMSNGFTKMKIPTLVWLPNIYIKPIGK